LGAFASDHKYADHEPITLWNNKVGPKNNPQETYNYSYLPFCKPQPDKHEKHAWAGLGEALQGNELVDSQLDIRFKTAALQPELICSMQLTEAQARSFQHAVENNYYFELVFDNLPILAFVGEMREGANGLRPFLYTHKRFDISYNANQVIHVNLTTEQPTEIRPGAELVFTYEVHWHPTNTPFSERFNRYLDSSFFEHKIHWFSIVNSFMMVFFLVGLVAVILSRTLRKDYARYATAAGKDLEALERELADESGWKLLHGDVGRPPRFLVLFAACVGTGIQMTLLTLCVVLLTIMGNLFSERGSILTAFITMYSFSSIVSGYVSGSYYARNGGKRWVRAFLLTALLFPGVCFGIAFMLNTIAIFYGSLAAVPFGYILAVISLWAFISFPLCLVGTLYGRHFKGESNFPCRVKRIPSSIPVQPWYLHPAVIMLAGGLLPFGSIFIEIYFIFTSFWNYKVYYVYGFMLLVLILLIMVTSCISICGTYFLLNAENWKWQWTSFGMAASTSLYAFLYAIHFFSKTKMTGLFQTAFYFGYTTMFTLGLALICGSVGYFAAETFVHRIFRNVKCD